MSQRSACTLSIVAAALPAALVALPHDWRFMPLHVAMLGVVLGVAWHGVFVDRVLAAVPFARWLLMAVASALLVWTLVGGSPRATWGMIDDHEVQMFIGPSRERIPAGDLPEMLAKHPEIAAPPFTMPRYRPAYYSLRLLECSAWGRRVGMWMLVRLVLFTLTATLAFDLLRQWLGFVAGGVTLAFLSTLWMWPKIFVTLGTAEAYAAPAVLAFAWCAARILSGPTAAGAVPWAGLAVAGVIAVGAKENFLVLAPLAMLVAGIEWRRSRLGPAGVLACLAVVAATLWVAIVVGSSIAAQGGRDVYGRPIGLSGFARGGDSTSWRAFRKVFGYGLPLLVATTTMTIAWLRGRGGPEKGRRAALAVGAVIGATALSQFVFYRGEVFKKSHYDLPFVPLICLLGIGAVVAVAARPSGRVVSHRIRRRLLVPGVLAIAAMACGGDHARHYVRVYASDTHAFSALVARMAAACRQDPARPVEFLCATDATGDYEAFYSVARYLRALGVTNPFFLNPLGLPAGDPRVRVSREGDHSFEPWSGFDPLVDAILICFSADPPASRSLAFRVK